MFLERVSNVHAYAQAYRGQDAHPGAGVAGARITRVWKVEDL